MIVRVGGHAQQMEAFHLDCSTPVVSLFSGIGTLGILRTLGKLGVDVHVVTNDLDSPVLRSRFCQQHYYHSLSEDDQESLIVLLQELGAQFSTKPLLIATSDELAIMVADQSEKLTPYYLIAQNTNQLTRQLADKMEMFKLAEKHGLPSPSTVLPSSLSEVESLIPSLSFPVMLKAVFGNRMQARSGRKMARADDAAELLRLYKELEDPEFPNILIQELIPGDDDQVWIFNGFFDASSKCTVPFTGRKIRQYPIHVGAASLGECTWNERVAEQTMQFMQAIQYRGILDIGFRYDARDDQYKVLDINPRVGQAFRMFVGENDIDVVKCQYLGATGQPIPDGAIPLEGRRWIIEDYDLVSSFGYMREGSLTFTQWLKSLGTVDERAWFDWRDIRPGLIIYWRVFKYCIKAVLNRLFGRKKS